MIFDKLKRFIKEHIEEHYDLWGTAIECNLPPEFIITDHAMDSMNGRFKCRPDKMHKIMVKAWKSQEAVDRKFIEEKSRIHERSIYKSFSGFIFVFRLRYNKRLGCYQKYLITVYKKSGYQVYGKH